MSTSISALQAAVNGTSTTSATTTDAVAEAEDRFLKLLIAQMQNQDPLNPLDNAEITSQMAQLSTVTGINKLNTALETLQSSMLTSQSYQATSMIGHSVFVAGSSVQLSSSTDTSGTTTKQGILAANLASAADTVTLTIKDSSGKAIYTESLGAQSAGMVTYGWDGKATAGTTAADGKYTFEIAASNAGTAVTVTNLAFGMVESVTNSTSGAVLNASNLGEITMSDIVQIY